MQPTPPFAGTLILDDLEGIFPYPPAHIPTGDVLGCFRGRPARLSQRGGRITLTIANPSGTTTTIAEWLTKHAPSFWSDVQPDDTL